MKKPSLSIRKRILLLFSFSMILILALAFFLIRLVTASVMEMTLSDYLMSAVDTNADKISYLTKSQAQEAKAKETDNLFISFENGVLRVDDDFLVNLNDVESALYSEDGQLLYGGNNILKDLPKETFQGSKVYETTIEEETYIVYDRKFTNSKLEGLWIRGLVPLTQQQYQLEQIAKTFLAFSPLILLIIIFVSMMAANSVLRPIRTMRKTASDIAGGNDLNIRINTEGPHDELYQLGEAFNDMFVRLEDSFNREKQFTSDASHELRTPLSVIRMQTEYMLRKKDLPEDTRDAFRVIHRQSGRMQTLVEDMLGLARLAQGGRRYPKENVNFSDIAKQICMDMAPLSKHNIQLDYHITPDIHIHGNTSLLERMLVNLIDNAYKYGKENGHTQVSLIMEKESCILTVSDDGIGMTKDVMAHIFERFYREDTSRGEIPGYGLGLSLVHQIVSYHQGTIEVTSKPDFGSNFKISIPLIFF
ncbi:MAG: HAMP domain-containing histidine kinase [Lachnospiraceae bacterium]|nr:HAMP domain-containing histidine kinase [Lachnospiraceae bacterium]